MSKENFYAEIREVRELPKDKRREPLKRIWGNEAANLLMGRRIVDVRYMTAKEQEDLDFYSAGLVLVLDNGHAIFPSKDDEGNDAGAMKTTFEDFSTFPTI